MQSAGNDNNSSLVASSETIRVDSLSDFNGWLGGFIDGSGHFSISPRGSVSCELSIWCGPEGQPIFKIYYAAGGYVKKPWKWQDLREPAPWALKWAGPKAMSKLAAALNGRLFLEAQYAKFSASCNILGIAPARHQPRINSAWAAGFFESRGSMHIKTRTLESHFALSHRDAEPLHELVKLWGGSVIPSEVSGWVWFLNDLKQQLAFSAYLLRVGLQIPTNRSRLYAFRRFLLYRERGEPEDEARAKDLASFFNRKNGIR